MPEDRSLPKISPVRFIPPRAGGPEKIVQPAAVSAVDEARPVQPITFFGDKKDKDFRPIDRGEEVVTTPSPKDEGPDPKDSSVPVPVEFSASVPASLELPVVDPSLQQESQVEPDSSVPAEKDSTQDREPNPGQLPS